MSIASLHDMTCRAQWTLTWTFLENDKAHKFFFFENNYLRAKVMSIVSLHDMTCHVQWSVDFNGLILHQCFHLLTIHVCLCE